MASYILDLLRPNSVPPTTTPTTISRLPTPLPPLPGSPFSLLRPLSPLSFLRPASPLSFLFPPTPPPPPELPTYFYTLPRLKRCRVCNIETLYPSRVLVNPSEEERSREMKPCGGTGWVQRCAECEKRERRRRRKMKGKGKVVELVPELGMVPMGRWRWWGKGRRVRGEGLENVEEVGEVRAGGSSDLD